MNKKPPRELLHGLAPVEEALRAARRDLYHLWYKGSARNDRVHVSVERARALGVPCVESSPDDLARRAQSRTHQGLVLSCGPLPLGGLRDISDLDEGVVLALDQIEDPQNLGALVRTCAFLGARAVLLHRSHRAPLGAAASKASAGTLEWFPLVETGNLSDALQRLARDHWRIVGSALEEGATPLPELKVHGPTVLVMGNEGRGLRPLTMKRCDELVMIPRQGNAESLNVTVAAGILLAKMLGASGQM